METVIMAGGRGTRISMINSQVPKPMIPIDGKPILQYQMETLKRQGIHEIILVIGHMGEVIQNYFGNGQKFDINIRYIVENQPLGTAGALYFLKEDIREDFLLLNGDILFDVDLDRFWKCHLHRGTMATILTHPNSHPYDSGIIEADEQGKVTQWLHKEDTRTWYRNRVNAGLHILSPRIFSLFPNLQKRDLDRDILKPLIACGELSIYDSPEYVRDMGTPERYYAVKKDIQEGKIAAKNLSKKQRAIFLDRDGTINRYVGFLQDINQFELLEGVSDAIRMINESGYLAIVITNQPVIARGEVSEAELREIHNKMETLLGQQGAYVDAIYYCPHHPDSGFEGERKELKIKCNCRKPKPGMLLKAAEEYNIDLASSWMVGDGESDMKAGKAVGCKLVKIGKPWEDTICYGSLLEAVKRILKEYR